MQKGCVYPTKTALKSAAALGFTVSDMLYVIESLEVSDLYKSMTSHKKNSIWHDVYHYPAEEGNLYIKLQIVRDVVIISFKEL